MTGDLSGDSNYRDEGAVEGRDGDEGVIDAETETDMDAVGIREGVKDDE